MLLILHNLINHPPTVMDQFKPIKLQACNQFTHALAWATGQLNISPHCARPLCVIQENLWQTYELYPGKNNVAQVNVLSKASSLFTLGAEDTYYGEKTTTLDCVVRILQKKLEYPIRDWNSQTTKHKLPLRMMKDRWRVHIWVHDKHTIKEE